MSSLAVAARNIHYRYPGSPRPALDGVSLEIAAGAFVALLGPNGSGKSTLLRLISQLDRPERSDGALEVAGHSDPQAIRGQIGVVFQSPSLDPRLTARENLALHARLQGLSASATPQRVDAVLASLQLADRSHEQVRTLSLGLARRVDLARALLHQPSILLLDEPTVGLDPPSRTAFLERVAAERRDRGATVLMSTHLIDEADLADRVVLMHQGRIVADGAPAALRASLGPRLLTLASGGVPELESLRGLAWLPRPVGAGGGMVAPLPEGPSAEGAIAALLATGASFTVAAPTLADLFAARTGEGLGASDTVGDRPATTHRGASGHARRRDSDVAR